MRPCSRNILLLLQLCAAQSWAVHGATAQQTPLGGLLRANRYRLTVRDGELVGPGAPFMKKLIAEAQFVAIGEEHGTREVPQFAWATCRAMASDHLDAMAIESGPWVTDKLQQWAAESDGQSRLAAFERQYPDSIAFFHWQQEFDLLSHCQQATAPHPLQLWGLDQEFLGSPDFMLEQILDTNPGGQVEAIAKRIQAQCVVDTEKSIATGTWKDSCMLRLSSVDLASLQSAVDATGNPRAQQLAAALVKTQHIYSQHETGKSYEANRERALLLKSNFLAQYRQLSQRIGRPPRVLLKFGGNHLFRGFDQTNQNDLGNFITEFADGVGTRSLHILVLGMRGADETEFGPGQPNRPVAKDAAPGLFAPLYAEAYPAAWTAFDLRPLRREFDSLGPVDREIERLIFGYDLLVLIPEVNASRVIQ